MKDRAPAWTGVEFLHCFLTENRGTGPYAEEAPMPRARPGDVIQLSFDGVSFGHSLLVVGTGGVIRIATYTEDSYDRPLHTYFYKKLRLLHIIGFRE